MRTLYIDDVDISTYGATLLAIDYGYATVTTYKDWLRGKKSPRIYEQEEQFSTAVIRVVVEAPTHKQLNENCSNLMSKLRQGVVRDSDQGWYLEGTFVEVADNQIAPYGRELEIQFEGVKYSQSETQTHTFTLNQPWTWVAKGNLETDCSIVITPNMGYATLTLTVNGKQFSITNVASGTKITIDGINGTVKAGTANKIADYTAWEFPVIKGGSNTITCNGTPTVAITYKGRWM